MVPFANTLAGADQDAIYVGGVFYSSYAVSPALSTFGVVAGDFAIFGSLNTQSVSSASGKSWTSLGSDGAFNVLYRTLDVVDVGGGIAAPTGSILMIYRGPILSCALVTRGGIGGLPYENGFGKHRAHVGLAAIAVSNADQPATSVVTPGFVRRGIAASTSSATGFDRLSPPNPTYVDLTRITVNYGTVSIYELRSE